MKDDTKEWAEAISKLTDREKKELAGDAGEFIAVARGMVVKKSVWISPTLYGMRWVPVWEPDATLAVTEQLVCYFNPYWIIHEPEFKDEKERLEKMAFAVFHEPWHPIHGINRIIALAEKGLRLGWPLDLAKLAANYADDMSINESARLAGYTPLTWAVFPSTFDAPTGLIMEENWEYVVPKIDELKQAAEEAGVLSPSGEGDGKSKGGKSSDMQIGPCSGACGGIAGDHNEKTKELEKRLNEQYGRHKSEVNRIRKTTINEMKAHEERVGRGSIPGFRSEMFDFRREKPLVHWETKLQHVMATSYGNIVPGDDDYSMLFPDRHSALLGICMPSLIEHEKVVVFVRDTSASMRDQQVNSTNNEIIHCMKALGVSSVWLIDADTEAKGKPRQITMTDLPKLAVRGRGGTDFRPVFDDIKKMFPRPNLVVYMTDGEGWAPEKKPRGFDVIWCIVPGHHRNKKPADWGHIIVCSNDRDVREKWADDTKKGAAKDE